MTVNKITEVTIFESPDGGRTVYARNLGDTHKTLYSREPALQQELDELEQSRCWVEIFEARKHNAELDHLCEQVEILYQLQKKTS